MTYDPVQERRDELGELKRHTVKPIDPWELLRELCEAESDLLAAASRAIEQHDAERASDAK